MNSKKDLIYILYDDDDGAERIVDDLRVKERPGNRNNLLLRDVLRRPLAFEVGDGLLPVKVTDLFQSVCILTFSKENTEK